MVEGIAAHVHSLLTWQVPRDYDTGAELELGSDESC